MGEELASSFASGGLSIASNLINGLFGSSNNKRTNNANLKIAQMNNEWNAREAEKTREFMTSERDAQNIWNLEQWNRENEYNSASAQRERLEAAGLNPYLMMSGGSAGSASSLQSSEVGEGPTPTAEPVQQTPFYPNVDLSGVAEAINSYFVNQKISSETVGQNTQNRLDQIYGDRAREASIASTIDGRFEFLNPSYQAGRYVEAPNLLGIDLDEKRSRLESLKIHQQLEVAQKSLAYVNRDAQSILNKYLDYQQQADLWIKSSQIFVNYQQGFLTKEKLRTEILNQVGISLDNAGKRISNKIAKMTADSLIDAMNQENEYDAGYYRFLKRYASSIAEFDKDNSFFNWKSNMWKSSKDQSDYEWRHTDRLLHLLGGAVAPATSAYLGSRSGHTRR